MPSSNNTRDDSTHGHHQMVNTKIRLQPKMEKLYTVSKNKTRGSDHELFIAKLRPKLKEVGKTTREGNGTPLQYSCLENPMDGGA